MTDKRPTVIRGGRLINAGGHRAEAADILIVGDTIAEVGRPALAAPADAITIDARDRLVHPGLINAHTHGHGNLAKGMGDRWTLELLLAAGPWITGFRTLEDKYLSTYVGAIEMLLKGCTACYDLTVEFPLPSVEGMDACGRAYADAGMRAVLAPMVAEFSFFEAIPGLIDALPPATQKEIERLRLAPGDATLNAMRQSMQSWAFDRALVRPAVAPTIPHHCSDDFMGKCATLAREFGVGLHTHVQESKAQVMVGLKRYGKTPTAHLQDLGLLGPDFTVGHGVWLDHDDMHSARRSRLHRSRTIRAATCGSATDLPTFAECWSARSMSASEPMAPTAPTISTCTSRCGSPRWYRNHKDPTPTAGSPPAKFSPQRPKEARARSASATSSAVSRRAIRPTSCSSICTA